jgi:L-asparagine oxygenase
LRNFRCNPRHPGYLVVKNLPVDDCLPDTPAHGGRAEHKKSFFSEGCLLALARLLGEPFAYRSEKAGEVIHTVAPVKGSETKASNEGSEVDFQPHVELAYFPFRPDHLVLFCLRSDANGEGGTIVADVRRACRLLSDDDLARLREPVYRIRAPQSFQQTHAEAWSRPMAILSGPTDFPAVVVNFNATEAETAAATSALQAFGRAVHKVADCICLKPGECLLVDNRKALHGRTKFAPRYDGKDRWLQRVYTRTELWSGRTPLAGCLRLF